MPSRLGQEPFAWVGPQVLRRPHGPLATPPFAGCYYERIIAAHPRAYFRLSETGTPTLVDVLGEHSGLYVGTPVFGQKGALTADPDTAIALDGSGAAYGEVAGWASLPPKPVALEAWIYHDGAKFLSVDTLIAGWQNGSGDSLALMGSTVDADTIRLGIFTDTGNSHYDWTPAGDTGWHHLIGLLRIDNTPWVYFDGRDVGTGGMVSYVGGNSANPFRIGSTTDAGVAGTQSWPGGIDEVAVYDYNLALDEIALHHQLGRYGCFDPSISGGTTNYDETDDWAETI